MAAWERFTLACQFAPHRFEAAFVPGQSGYISMRECALVEAPLPSGNCGCCGRIRTTHRSQADLSAIGDIPEWRECQLGLCVGPLVFRQRTNLKAAVRNFPDQWRLRKGLPIEVRCLAFRIRVKHLLVSRRTPPDKRPVSFGQDILWKHLCVGVSSQGAYKRFDERHRQGLRRAERGRSLFMKVYLVVCDEAALVWLAADSARSCTRRAPTREQCRAPPESATSASWACRCCCGALRGRTSRRRRCPSP